MFQRTIVRSLITPAIIAAFFAACIIPAFAAVQRTIQGPPGSGNFGASVAVLPNGNIVVADPTFNGFAGAVYLYNGATGAMISRVTGVGADRIGDYGIQVTPKGDFFIRSPHWGGDRGAITFGDQNTGVSGIANTSNSIVSDAVNDLLGFQFAYQELPNKNYVIRHYSWHQNRGAVIFVNSSAGVTGTISAANSLVGANPADYVGVSMGPLENDHYAIMSYSFNGGAGAFTLCSAVTGCTGQVSAANSFVGNTPAGRVGASFPVRLTNGNYVLPSANTATFFRPQDGLIGSPSTANSLIGDAGSNTTNVYPLANGNYVVAMPGWNAFRGSVTFGNGSTGITGTVSAANSLVGSVSDLVGQYVTLLPNGNYVVRTPDCDSGGVTNAGAVTFGNGMTGTVGEITQANSLIGDEANDRVGEGGVIVLANGNYVAASYRWRQERGAVTFGSGTTGVSGIVSASNSLVGTTAMDRVGFGVDYTAALTGGDYVQVVPQWDNGAVANVGAVTRCSGTTGCTGQLTPANSIIGAAAEDRIGSQAVFALPNNNFVFNSPNWNGGRGASTWVSGATALGNMTVSSANSLTGNTAGDNIGIRLQMLPNGNYLLRSSSYDNGAAKGAGVVTFVNRAAGLTGSVSPANSLMGSFSDDRVGARDIAVLPNSNYYVGSEDWNGNRGALTFGSGTAGVSGVVSAANSLVGSKPNDEIGRLQQMFGGTGEYFSASAGWDNGSIVDAGAVTYLNGNALPVGEVSVKSSLIGTAANQNLGAIVGNQGLAFTVLPDGSFYFKSKGTNGSGAVTLYRRGSSVVGNVAYHNSVFARPGEVPANLSVSYHPTGNWLAVGQPINKVVTILRKETPFDFDGDDRADISYFRPGPGSWRYIRSTDGTEGGADFGQATDHIVPADYTGDSRADVAIFRPSTGTWYILRSDTATVDIQAFGAGTDTPVTGDYDADGRADVGVFRPATGNWFINRSTMGLNIYAFGTAGDIPIPKDYDRDGLTDIGIFRPNAASGNGEWWIQRSSTGLFVTVFGADTDRPVPADYSGEGTNDIAFRRPSDGNWYVLQMEDFNFYAGPFGNGADTGVPADYDGDGKTDFAVFQPASAAWYVQRSTGGIDVRVYGAAGDKPVPAAYLQN